MHTHKWISASAYLFRCVTDKFKLQSESWLSVNQLSINHTARCWDKQLVWSNLCVCVGVSGSRCIWRRYWLCMCRSVCTVCMYNVICTLATDVSKSLFLRGHKVDHVLLYVCVQYVSVYMCVPWKPCVCLSVCVCVSGVHVKMENKQVTRGVNYHNCTAIVLHRNSPPPLYFLPNEFLLPNCTNLVCTFISRLTVH